MRVERRQVYRWFTGGKGFHNETLAYRYLAKKELGKILQPKIDAILIRNHGDCCRSADITEKREALAEMFPSRTDYYPFSQGAYRTWLEVKIKELQEADGK